MRQFVINVEGYLSNIPQAAFTPDDVLRELVLNSLQSCALMKSRNSAFSPRIHLEIPDRLRMQVTDNGVGFHPQVLDKLGELHISKWSTAAELVGVSKSFAKPYGRFGMGLTSTINICQELLIITCPLLGDSKRTYYWWTDWKTGWDMWADDEEVPERVPTETIAIAKRSPLTQTGARVLLTLKDEAWAGPQPWNAGRLEKLVRHYFSAVSTPIYVGASTGPVNDGVKGWPTEGDQRSSQNIIQKWLKSRGYDEREAPESPFHCYPIEFFDAISGVIWINRVRMDTVHFFAHEVFGREIFALLPDRGQFVSAIVNDDKAILDITKTGPMVATLAGARREENIRSAISTALTKYINWLNDEFKRGDQETKEIVLSIGARYGRPMMSYLLKDATSEKRKIAEEALEWIAFPIFRPRGSRTLPECETKETSGPVIYYVSSKTDLARYQMFPQEIIVDARDESNEVLLHLYQQAHAEQRKLRAEEVQDPVLGQIRELAPDEVKQAGFSELHEQVARRWREGEVVIGDVPSILGTAFAYMIGSPRGSRKLVLNKNNDAIELMKSLEGKGLAAAAAHIVDFSRLLVSGQITGPEFDDVSKHFSDFVIALSRHSVGA